MAELMHVSSEQVQSASTQAEKMQQLDEVVAKFTRRHGELYER
jgi:hypothetical protein